MRTYNHVIEVVADASEPPRAFTWADHEYVVTGVIEHWVVQENWWELLEVRSPLETRSYEHWLVTARGPDGDSRAELERIEGTRRWRLVCIEEDGGEDGD